MRLLPRTTKGKVMALLFAPWALFVLALIILVVYWEWMSYALAALFVFYGGAVVLLGLGLFLYLFLRRNKLAAFWPGWRGVVDRGGRPDPRER
tara:strand:+ start:205 stop:483 length:279 start_codon:yes stop_codon:yes gene_type:complete